MVFPTCSFVAVPTPSEIIGRKTGYGGATKTILLSEGPKHWMKVSRKHPSEKFRSMTASIGSHRSILSPTRVGLPWFVWL